MKATLAEQWKGTDPAGWWMSEKLDGVRALWDGSRFISRNGKTFNAPEWFTAAMPVGQVIDGELWMARNQFQKTAGMIRRKSGSWQGMKFMAFDIVNDQPLESRQSTLHSLPLPAHCRIVKQTKCESRAHFKQYEAALLDADAEGVMLRRPASHYYHGRTRDLLKVKRFGSSEATVTGHDSGTLLCKWEGLPIRIGNGFTAQDRQDPPAIGQRVTFNYFGRTTQGQPRHAAFVTARDYEGAGNEYDTEVVDMTPFLQSCLRELNKQSRLTA